MPGEQGGDSDYLRALCDKENKCGNVKMWRCGNVANAGVLLIEIFRRLQ